MHKNEWKLPSEYPEPNNEIIVEIEKNNLRTKVFKYKSSNYSGLMEYIDCNGATLLRWKYYENGYIGI